MIIKRKPATYVTAAECPQAGRERMIMAQPISTAGPNASAAEREQLRHMYQDGAVFMMGQNPELPVMPKQPKLLDFFHFRFCDMAFMHLLQSAKLALDAGQEEKVVIACLLHDIANGALIRADHGYWGAQLIAPYVDPEVAWAVQYHQALRYFPDESVGYAYPETYEAFFGADFEPPEYIRRDAAYAQGHAWYMTSRIVTIYDTYFFEDYPEVDPEIFTDLIGRNWKQPDQGLGFDNSPSAHMWRTMIWPNNFL